MPTTVPSPLAPGALAGLKVLEMGALIAGPFCAKLLGEFGAVRERTGSILPGIAPPRRTAATTAATC